MTAAPAPTMPVAAPVPAQPSSPAVAPAVPAGLDAAIPRAELSAWLAEDDALIADARLLPEAEGGVRLFGLRHESPLARLGLQNGDTVHAIDGRPVTSAETLVAAWSADREASEHRVALSRAGERRELLVRVLD